MVKILTSNIDQSVNFVEEQLTGFLESRYVRKVEDYFICYLSSQTGCNRGCKFCHLTVTGQTGFRDSTYSDFIGQANKVFEHYEQEKPAKYVHYNFMARGEPLANKNLLSHGDDILLKLGQYADNYNLRPKFNISTILPQTLDKPLVDIFKLTSPTIYYSLYSVSEVFRDKWLPTALPIYEAFSLLKEYQQFSKKIIKIHHCFIKGENDSKGQVDTMLQLIHDYGLHCEFNLVRYNPFSPEQGEESSEDVIESLLEMIKKELPYGAVKVIPRVGFDVKASCGMFVEKSEDS